MNSSDKALHPKGSLREITSKRLNGLAVEDLDSFLYLLTADTAAYEARKEWRALLGDIADPYRLEHFGRKICSQSDEDGIIEEIFRRLDLNPHSGKFVEFGVEDGLECNAHYLLHGGFSGLWIECSESHVRAIRTISSAVGKRSVEICSLICNCREH